MVRGKILNYNNDLKSGFLRDENEKRYHFFRGDCSNPEKLTMGADVHFEQDGEKATKITVIESVVDTSVAEEKFIKAASAKKSKKIISTFLILTLLLTIGGLVVIQRMSIIQERKLEEIEKKYESQIKNINKYLLKEECSKAALEYNKAGDTRREIYKYGAYYSIETHAQHAHAIDIAECFANKKDFKNAIKMLDSKSAHTPNYFNRASIIYQKAGDSAHAREMYRKGEEFLP